MCVCVCVCVRACVCVCVCVRARVGAGVGLACEVNKIQVSFVGVINTPRGLRSLFYFWPAGYVTLYANESKIIHGLSVGIASTVASI